MPELSADRLNEIRRRAKRGYEYSVVNLGADIFTLLAEIERLRTESNHWRERGNELQIQLDHEPIAFDLCAALEAELGTSDVAEAVRRVRQLKGKKRVAPAQAREIALRLLAESEQRRIAAAEKEAREETEPESKLFAELRGLAQGRLPMNMTRDEMLWYVTQLHAHTERRIKDRDTTIEECNLSSIAIKLARAVRVLDRALREALWKLDACRAMHEPESKTVAERSADVDIMVDAEIQGASAELAAEQSVGGRRAK